MSETRIASFLSPPEMFALDLACKPIFEAFNDPPYLVGSVTERRDFRDVDVRLILDDDTYSALRGPLGQQGLAFLGFAIGAYLKAATGLPVDFQIQQRTAANERHGKPRNPLGLRHLNDFVGDAPGSDE